MSYTVKLEQYEGPLDLLLQLIEAEKLDVSEISLAQVTDDYLQLVESNPDLPPEELADFLVIASRLLLIKSRLLLPYLQMADEDEDGQDLEDQLRIYKSYLDASVRVAEMTGGGRLMFVRKKLPQVEVGFSPPRGLTLRQICEMFVAVAKRLEPPVKQVKQALERAVSIHDKIRQIKDILVRAKRTSFRGLIGKSSSKLEVIVSFLALLELVKQRSVAVVQKGRFDDINITGLGVPDGKK